METRRTEKISTILWASDFSRESLQGLRYLKLFADTFHAVPLAIHVLPRISDWIFEAAFVNRGDLFQEMEKIKNEARLRLSHYGEKTGLDIDATVAEGIASQEILAHAEQKGADLIIISKRGTSKIKKLLIGSTASRIIRRSTLPVLVVCRRPRATPLKQILAPVDFHSLSLIELKYALFLARAFSAELSVTHISEIFNYPLPVIQRQQLVEKANERIQALASEAGYPVSRIIHETGEPAGEIIKLAQRGGADLIVMATHQRKGIERLFLGSITEKVLLYADTPMLILPPALHD